LLTLRAGRIVTDVDESMGEMILSSLIARDHNTTDAVDVIFQMDSPAGRQTFQIRLFETQEKMIYQEHIDIWLASHKSLFTGNEISMSVTGFVRCLLPTSEELHRLGRIAGHQIPNVFGPEEVSQAISKYENGDIPGCMQIFIRMLADKESFHIRNNLAFCQILTGDVAAGLENATKAVVGHYTALHELNKGLAEFLLGNVDASKKSLRNALNKIRALKSEEVAEATEAAYVLLLEPTSKEVNSHADLPVEAAILINLYRMGDLMPGELEIKLMECYPDSAQTWLTMFIAP
jgi:hypothetical protein